MALTLAVATWGGAALAEEFRGAVHVIDGDTLDVGAVRVRLEGIDAPEMDQMCDHPTEGLWACGVAVKTALADWLDGWQVRCERVGQDRHGRVLAICYRGDDDIGAVLVDQGLAFAYKKYSQRYVEQEKGAVFAGRGLWTSAVVPPEAHRAAKRAPKNGVPPSDNCVIKGNVSRDGKRIYHMPGQQFYEATGINTGAGEKWFCTEAEARMAGWRRARR